MSKAKIAISLDRHILKRLDHFIRSNIFESRSSAIEEAIADKIERMERSRLARECAKLDPIFEKALAEEGLSKDLSEWPEY